MWLVMLKGLSGCGKSTIGRALSKQLGWPIIDKDDVKDLLDGQAKNAGPLAYNIMLNIARSQLLQGMNVICDSPFLYKQTYERAQAIAEETHASLVVVELLCSNEELWKQRINARKGLRLPAHHQTDWDAFQGYLSMISPQIGYSIVHPHLIVDTVAPLYECVGKIVGWLERLQKATGETETNINYYLTLPKKRMASGTLFRDEVGNILIVKPIYRPEWLLPGGSIDEDESPLDAAKREVKEELNLEAPIGRLLCVDYVYREQNKTESLYFVFDGGTLHETDIQQIELPASELSEYRFVPLAEATVMLHWRIAKRLVHCLPARVGDKAIYLENSQPVWQ
ncbi:MAG TPA: AAA family ATPase [Ktedonobacteraceae bacterium]|nr:AAA family ATPase [Ktedonobacteraceae bacterium]